MSVVPSPFAPRRGPRPRLTRGTIARKKQWDTWEVLIVVDGKRKYLGSFEKLADALEAREHTYQERLAGRPIPDYRMTDEQRVARARSAGREGRRRQLAGLPPKAKRKPIALPRNDECVARCRCGLALPCNSCLTETAKTIVEGRRAPEWMTEEGAP